MSSDELWIVGNEINFEMFVWEIGSLALPLWLRFILVFVNGSLICYEYSSFFFFFFLIIYIYIILDRHFLVIQ